MSDEQLRALEQVIRTTPSDRLAQKAYNAALWRRDRTIRLEVAPDVWRELPPGTLTQDLFVPPEDQIHHLHQWNAAGKWGFTTSEIESMRDSIPPWPIDRTNVALALVPYLAPKHKPEKMTDRTSAGETLKELWKIARQGRSFRCITDITFSQSSVRLMPAIVCPERTLRWERLDLLGEPDDYDSSEQPLDPREPNDSPHAGVMAAAAHHPLWLDSVFSSGLCIYLPGYDARDPKNPGDRWEGTVALACDEGFESGAVLRLVDPYRADARVNPHQRLPSFFTE